MLVGGVPQPINGLTVERTFNGQGGSGGYGNFINDNGDIVLKVSASGNSSGAYVFDITP